MILFIIIIICIIEIFIIYHRIRDLEILNFSLNGWKIIRNFYNHIYIIKNRRGLFILFSKNNIDDVHKVVNIWKFIFEKVGDEKK